MQIGDRVDRNAFYNFHPVPFESNDFTGVVGEKSYFADAEIGQDLSSGAIFAQIHRIAEAFICLDGIESLFLKLVGMDLGGETDAPPLLSHIHKDSMTTFSDLRHRLMQLTSAVAATGAEDIARQTFTMNSNKSWLLRVDRPLDECQMMFVINLHPVEEELEIAEVGRHMDFLFTHDEFFTLSAVGDQVANGADFQTMLFLEFHQVGKACHRSILIEDLADDPGGIESREPGKIDSGLGMTRAPKNSSLGGLKGKDMAGLAQILGSGFRIT